MCLREDPSSTVVSVHGSDSSNLSSEDSVHIHPHYCFKCGIFAETDQQDFWHLVYKMFYK